MKYESSVLVRQNFTVHELRTMRNSTTVLQKAISKTSKKTNRISQIQQI